MEYKNNKLQLPNVTLLALTSVKVYETVKALEYSMKGIDFGEVVLVTHRKPFRLAKGITYKHTSKLTNIDCFNYKMVYELADYVNTEYVLIIHYDGYVVHPECFREEFLDYDYIGSPWPYKEISSYRDSKGNIGRVGNSVSIRSKRLLEYPRKANLKWEVMDDGFYNEDTFLCSKHRNEMEDAGMVWAPIDVAKYFGHEHPIPEIEGITPFLFHKWWGRNSQYPEFKDPITVVKNKGKDLVRPLLFWRKFRK